MFDTDSGVPTPLPLNRQVAKAREDRGITPTEAAEAVGMSMRAYRDFENGKTKKLQPRNRRAVVSYFGLEDDPASAAAAREVTLESWPNDIHVFLDMLGAFLATMDAETRLEWMHDETRRIFAGR